MLPCMLTSQEPVLMKATVRLLACLSLAALSTTAVHAQLGYGNYPYGSFMAEHGGMMLTGYDGGGYPILDGVGKSEKADASGQFNVRGLSRGDWNYANPAGGGYSASLDVPAAALRSSVTAPPELHLAYNGIDGYWSGHGLASVGFQDVVTISGPPLAAYQTIPITLRAHLDGTLTPGNGAYPGRNLWYNYGEVRFNVAFRGKDGTQGFGIHEGHADVHFAGSVTEGTGPLTVDQDFLLTGDFGPTVSGAPMTFWLAADLLTDVRNGGSASFENTATFELILPEGYTYTSSLGFGTAVPEPTHAALVAALGLLGVAAWRRCRARAVTVREQARET